MQSSERPQESGGIERWLERRYARVGARYPYEILGVFGTWALVVLGLGVGGLTLFLGGSPRDFASLLVVLVPCVLAVFAAGFAVWVRSAQPYLAWIRGAHSREAAPHVWSTAIAAPVRLTVTMIILAVPVELAFSFYAADVLDSGLQSVPVIFLGSLMLVSVASGGAAIFGGQLAVRPLLREIAPYLPADSEIGRSRFGLAQQLVGRLLMVGLLMSLLGGAVAVAVDDPLGRFALALTVGPIFMLLLGGFLFPMAAVSLLGPVNDLIAANRRVASGDLNTEVPVVTGDELGELSRSFNEMTADLRRMTADLRDSRARIVAESDASRRDVERDLHDGAQQHLVLLQLKLGQARRVVDGDAEAVAIMEEAQQDLARALAELRDLAHGIYPAVLENDGLAGALEEAAERAAIRTEVECDGAGRYSRELEAAIYFCCLEALQNAAKHAGEGARASVRLGETPHGLAFEISDDGGGYDPAAVDGSAGLQNMTDRIGALGGALSFESAPGRGTKVTGTVPLNAKADGRA